LQCATSFCTLPGMTEKQLSGVRARLERFLGDLVEPMGRSERRQWAQIYVQGLRLDGQRKSVQPMAERIAADDEAAAPGQPHSDGRTLPVVPDDLR
jgi:hypothetical protein